MQTERPHSQPRANAPSYRAEPCLPLGGRLAITALIAAVNLWIALAEVIPRQPQPLVIRAHQETP